MPFLYRRMICRHAARFRWLHDLFEPMAVLSLAMIDVIVCRKGRAAEPPSPPGSESRDR